MWCWAGTALLKDDLGNVEMLTATSPGNNCFQYKEIITSHGEGEGEITINKSVSSIMPGSKH